MSKSSKDAKGHDNSEALEARLATVINAEAAKELAGVYQRAEKRFDQGLADLFEASLGGCIDGCEAVAHTHLDKGTPLTADALDLVVANAQHAALCCMLTLCAKVAVRSNTRGSEYIGHVMTHYESAATEQVRMDREAALKSMLETVLGPVPTSAPPTTPPEAAN